MGVPKRDDIADAQAIQADVQGVLDAIWPTYERGGGALARMYSRALKEAAQDLARGRATVALKSGGMGRLAVREKAAPGMTTVELPVKSANILTAARAALGDDQIDALLAEATKRAGDTKQPAAGGAAEQPVMKQAKPLTFEQ